MYIGLFASIVAKRRSTSTRMVAAERATRLSSGRKQRRRFATLVVRSANSESMRDTGRAVLYLTEGPDGAAVTDWPGVLKFRVRHKRVGSHNLARRRVDVWFADSDGREWHGVNYGHNSQLCHCRRLARHDANFRADSLRCRSTPGRLPPRSRPVTREALPAPWCCRSIGPTLPARGATDVLRSRSTPGRLPHAPGRSLGKRCRPRGAAGQDRPHAPGPVVLPTCCAPGQLPAGCPHAPGRSLGKRCRPRGAADVPRCRSTPGRLPHAPGPSLGKRCRPRGAADVLRCRSTPGRLPHSPGPSLGNIAGPWCCRRAALPAGCRRAGLPAPRRCRSTPGRVPRRRLSNRGRKWLET